MDFDTIWQTEDEITTMVDASVGCGIWQLSYDAEDRVIRLELEQHLDDEQADMLSSQFTVSGYYDGEGSHGSMFVFQIESV
jgi:hypothetical protein